MDVASCVSQIPYISQGIPHPRSFKDILADMKQIPPPTKRTYKVWFADACQGAIPVSAPKKSKLCGVIPLLYLLTGHNRIIQ